MVPGKAMRLYAGEPIRCAAQGEVIEDDRKGRCRGRPRNPGGRDEDGVERDVDRDPCAQRGERGALDPVMIKRIGPGPHATTPSQPATRIMRDSSPRTNSGPNKPRKSLAPSTRAAPRRTATANVVRAQ